MTDAVAPATPRKLTLVERLDAYERLMRLDKPIGTLLLLWPTLCALWFAAGGRPRGSLVLIFVVGTLVTRSAGCAMNDWADRDYDAHVARTAKRPLATREIAPWEALMVAAIGALLAFLLVLFTNRATMLWSIPALLIAVAYPFVKRVFALPQAFLGIAFSFGIPMAYAAVLNRVPPIAWAYLVVNLFWVVAYDTEYAMVDREDDLKAGAKSTAILFGDADLPILGVLMGTFLLAMVFVGQRAALGWPYWLGLLVAAGLFGYQHWLIRDRLRDACLAAFRHNNWLGLAVWIGIVLALAVR